MLWCNDNDSLPSGGNVTKWTPETGLSQCQAASPASTLVQTLASHLCLYLCFISFFSILPHVLFSFVNVYSWWLEYFKAALGPSIARLQLSRDEVTPLNKSMQYSAEKSRPHFLHNNCNVAKSNDVFMNHITTVSFNILIQLNVIILSRYVLKYFHDLSKIFIICY